MSILPANNVSNWETFYAFQGFKLQISAFHQPLRLGTFFLNLYSIVSVSSILFSLQYGLIIRMAMCLGFILLSEVM